jgi:hypothetical protein
MIAIAAAPNVGPPPARAATVAEFESWPRERQDDLLMALVYGLYDTFAAFERPDYYYCLRAQVGVLGGTAFDPESAGVQRARAAITAARAAGPEAPSVEETVRHTLFDLATDSCA